MRTIESRVCHIVAAAVAAVVAGCAEVPVGTPLQSSASAAAPGVAVGDTWTYRVRDAFTGLPRANERFRVTEAGNGRITVAVSHEGAADEVRVFDDGWKWLTHPATYLQAFDYTPAYPAFDFPLSPGKTWRTRLVATDPQTRSRFPVIVSGTVLGWERIKVPAGEFDTLRIKRIVYFDYWETGWRGRSEIQELEWYAPAVKQAVRRDYSARYLSFVYGNANVPGLLRTQGGRDGDGGMGYVYDDWLVSELESYSVR